jgi:microcystin-dependent protein
VALETFNYLDSLVPANPPVSDGVVQGDDHIRGIKLALKNTFPNVTGAVTGTQADLNTVAGWAKGGAAVLKGAGAFFDTNTTDGFKNTLAGDIDVVLQGNIAATFQRTGGADAGGKNFFKVFGGIEATGEIKGPGITPIGGTLIWWDDVLPTDGLWTWANGDIITNAATVCPILLARWKNRYGGDGITSMGLPNMQELVPVGKSNMGGKSPPQSFLPSIATAIKQLLYATFGEDYHALSQTEMPAHFHTASIYDPGHSHSCTTNTSSGNGVTGGGGFALNVNTTSTNTGQSGTGVRINSSNGIDNTYSTGGNAAHNNMQPSRFVNWIIRLG